MPLREEIERAFVKFKAEDGGDISAEFAVPPADSALFAGHFPDAPVLPGVCLLQCVLAAISKAGGKHASLVSVSKARFNSAVFPGDTVLVTGRPSWNGDDVTGKFALSKQSEENGGSAEKVASVALAARTGSFN